MKVQRYDTIEILDEQGLQCLNELRAYQGFNAKDWIQYKIERLKDFFISSHRDSVILGISGGIDSAVTLLLFTELSKIIDLKIHPVCIPMGEGVTNQDKVIEKSQRLCSQADLELIVIPFSSFQKDMTMSISKIVDASQTIWSSGQFASCLRSPVYYYLAALFTDQGEKPVVCGTINRSEGCYLGYWGKTSDASVDIQVIADLLKSEVYEVAKFLGVPEEIINATPQGDVYDGSTDEQLFGVSYDALELFILNKCWPHVLKAHQYSLPHNFNGISKRIEAMHQYNAHKYIGPAFGVWGNHLNVMDAGCPGGWPTQHVKDTYPTMIHGEFQ